MTSRLCPHCGGDISGAPWLAEYARSPEGRENTRRLGLTRRKHGASDPGSPLFGTYRSWQAMKRRCDSPRDTFYDRYGGRGITYDPRWAAFEAFLADMGERPEGTTLDRTDNDGPYTKANCRWATLSEQRRNRLQPSGWKRRPPAVPVVYGTKTVPCNGGCGRSGEVVVTSSRGWRCPDCKLAYNRAAAAKSKARAGRPTCSEVGCLNPVDSRGLCSKHYQRLMRAEKREAGH